MYTISRDLCYEEFTVLSEKVRTGDQSATGYWQVKAKESTTSHGLVAYLIPNYARWSFVRTRARVLAVSGSRSSKIKTGVLA